MANYDSIPIVLAANQQYVPVLFVCIHSIIKHKKQGSLYKIFIFHTDICKESQREFESYLADGFVQIKFMNVKRFVVSYRLEAKEHISTETFFRFLILDILKEYEKVLYLDCDLIVCRDIEELFHTDLKDNYLGAAHDPDFMGQCNDSSLTTREYCSSVLKMRSPWDYFQAGVLLLNVKELRKHVKVHQLFEMADTGIYRYSDQDILNSVCEGHVKELDMAWNFMTDCSHTRRKEVISLAPDHVILEYDNARKNPYIVHYAGPSKPWKDPEEDFAHLFWKEARETIYYEELFAQMITSILSNKEQEKKWANRLKRKAKDIFPQNSKSRVIVRRLYHKLKKKN